MIDMINKNSKCLNDVLKSVENSHKSEAEIKLELDKVNQFIIFITQKADEIAKIKFQAVENEITNDLQNFPFDEKTDFDFSAIQDKLSQLPVVIQKFTNILGEYAKLKDKPNRYDCHKAMEDCKKIASLCVNDMKTANFDKVITALDAYILKLITIKKEFETENQILENIDKLKKQHAATLNKYKAFKIEMDQFVASFPNNRDTDLKTVEQRILALDKVDKMIHNLGTEAKKISAFPDKYGCHKALEDCKKMILTCVNEMKFADCDHKAAELNTILSSIRAIQKEFDVENKIKTDIQNLLNNHSAILSKYAAFKTEIDQIVIKGTSTDLKTVEQRLLTLSEIDKLYQQIDGVISQVQNFADRYQKNATIQQVSQDLIFARTQMKYHDTNKMKHDFGLALTGLSQIVGEFENEKKTAEKILKALQERKPDSWAEDNEQLISELTAIIGKDTRKTAFVLRDFLNRIQRARDKKKLDIEAFEQYNGSWLKRSKNRESLDTEIRNKYVSLEEFKTFIDSRKGVIKQFFNNLIYKK